MSEVLKYDGHFVKLREQTIDGLVFEKVYLRPGVVIFAITENDELLMVEELRVHENPPVRLKTVAGLMEEGEDPLETANREMQEEIGKKASDLRPFWHTKSSGTINAETHYILARGLSDSKIPNPDGEHTIQKVIKIPLRELFEYLVEEKIPNANHNLGLYRLANRWKAGTLWK